MNIYFAGSISGGRQDADLYAQLIEVLKNHGTVLTEHIGEANLTNQGEQLSPQAIHDRDLKWVMESDLVVAEVTTPSLGVGYEIRYAIERNIPVLCLYRPQEGKRLSAMIGGSQVRVVEYQTIEKAMSFLDDFFKSS